MAHRRVEKDDEQLPTISVDYGFLRTSESSAHELPILVVSLVTSCPIQRHRV